MARDAGRGGDVVIVVDVAIGALPRRHSMKAGQGKAGRGVIKRPVGPQVRVMALFAGGRESRRRVGHRGGRVVVVSLVARDAGRIRNRVIVVHVAINARAWRDGVVAGQREARVVVIEGCIHPRGRAVAYVAGLR